VNERSDSPVNERSGSAPFALRASAVVVHTSWLPESIRGKASEWTEDGSPRMHRCSSVSPSSREASAPIGIDDPPDDPPEGEELLR
jgi:hypothetical protein